MPFSLCKGSISLTAKAFSLTKRSVEHCPKFHTISSYLRIMSSRFGVGSYQLNSSQDYKKTETTENVDENLIKSENDSMEYRLIKLQNGLRAILVSDQSRLVDLSAVSATEVEDDEDVDMSSEESEHGSYIEESQNDPLSEEEDRERKPTVREAEEKMAACALCIGVGSFSDPPDIPGLAHFLEHMVFMGSTKYPQENGFDEFIKKHGGSDNGSTECEITTFYLECSEKYLREGMERFAQFFISPLMKREAMTRERQVIHSEFEMSLPSDDTRREQILGSLAPPDHPAAKFLWGNLKTLAEDIDDNSLYERVHEFRKRHYSAHRMSVAVQARLSLDTLEDYVRQSFSSVPSNDLPAEDFRSYNNTFGAPENFNKIVWVKPVKDICQTHLTWVLPSYMKEYKSRPLDYIAWLIGHEGEGSLLSHLRKKVWALECEAGNDESGFEHNSIYSLFSTYLTLTEEGYEKVDEVINLVFSYISMLKEKCPNKKIFDELRTICETNFRYKTEIPSANYVEILAESMHLYEPKHYIAGRELYLQYKPELITEILNLLTPDRVNVIIYSKENPDSFYDKVEPWFQTKHKIQDIPSEWKEKWQNSRPIGEFHLPLPNPYLTNDFSLLEKPETNPPYPVKILDDELIELWYRQDVKFKQPLAYFSFYIVSPILKSNSHNIVALDLLVAYLQTKFTEYIFPANEACLYCTFFPTDLGISLHFSGYNEKLPLLFDEMLKLLKKCCGEIKHESNEKLFNAIKKGKSRSYYNKFLKPKRLVKTARLALLVDCLSTEVENFKVVNDVTLQQLHDFGAEFFSRVKILGLIQGNVSKELSLELCEKFKTVLLCGPLKEPKPEVRVTKLKRGESYLRIKSFNETDSNSVVINYYQVGPTNIRTSCMIDILMMLMDEPLFDSLRTKQQIGYDIQCFLRDTFGILGFSITVFFQSHKFTADEVDDRIEAFLKSFLVTLKRMSKREWEEVKSSLISLKSSADLQLQDEVKRNFAEIYSGEFVFDRPQREVEIIPEITHKELCSWYADHIAEGKNFKKLSVQVVGPATKSSVTNTGSPEVRQQVDGSEYSDLLSETEENFQMTLLTSEGEKKNLFITDIEEFKRTREFYELKKKS